MASTTEGRYSRFLRRVLLWAVGAGVIAGAAIAATLLAGGRASAQPLTIPGVGTFEVPDQISIPSIPAVADSGAPSEIGPAEVPGKELSAPRAVPGAEVEVPLGVPSNELSIPPTIPGAMFSAPLAFLNIERSALPLISTVDAAPSCAAPVAVQGKELSAPLAAPGSVLAVPLRAVGVERSALPLVSAVENYIAPLGAAPVAVQGKELSAPLAAPGSALAVPLRAVGVERSALPLVSAVENYIAPLGAAPVAVQGKELSAPLAAPGSALAVSLRTLGIGRSELPLIPAVEDPVAVPEFAPVEVRGNELSIPLGVPGAQISIPVGVLGLERFAPLAIPGAERSAPQAGRSLPVVIPWGERSAPEAGRSAPAGAPGAEPPAFATIPGTGITVPADMFRSEIAYLSSVLGIKPPASPPVVAPQRTHGEIAVDAARGKVGTGYSMGATGPDVFDCSGLVQWSYKQAGVKVPRTSYEQLSEGTPVAQDELEPGDVVSFYDGSHSALYAGDGKVIHASTYGTGVIMSPMSSMPYAGARRY
ncbi:NlpC/P60 family protein [Nocardia sp. CA-135953]|uniref:C40 family peptidase n=1 Tax=Nocardia sp. CA-135953 TaxID=3239978 RepID=UPI003D994A3F